MQEGLWLSVLGPVRAWRAGAEVELGTPQQRAVLTFLLLHNRSQISMGELVDALWGEQAPANPHGVIRTYVSRLRRLLETDPAGSPPLIRTVGGGYAISPPPDGFDLAVFRNRTAAADEARRAQDLPRASRLLGEALALWQGEALAGITGTQAQAEREQLELLRLGTLATHLAVRLDLGAAPGVVPDLVSLVDRHPLDERFREMLMLALYRSGQQARALASYRNGQALLAAELGVDPGPGLQSLYERILRADPGLLAVQPPAVDATHPRSAAAPQPMALAPLPRPLTVFAGREDELAQANDLLFEQDAYPGAVVVTGTAGVGKTTFAVHWAHQIAPLFPDGRLYLNLRGFDPAGPPMTAAETVRSVLELLGVAPLAVPESIDAMTALYRGLVADRRILLLLDNARSAAQVRPLLSGHGGCLVIVTSRNQLTGLAAIDGARSVTLDLLTWPGARDLLIRRLGRGRTQAEPAAVEEIIRRCARLPLALAIVAAHCATRPAFPLAAITAALRDDAGRLDPFRIGDRDSAANVREVFSWSYHGLTPEAGRLFRTLALHPGPDFTAAAAASLAGLPRRTADDLLAELTGAHLLTEHTPGRFACHDLLRVYSGELNQALDTPADNAAARHRLFDHYSYTAHTAAFAYNPLRDPVDLPALRPGTIPEAPANQSDALRWFGDEHKVLLAIADSASDHGFDQHVWLLAWALDTFLFRAGHWQDGLAVHTMALEAAGRLEDPLLEGRSRSFLAAANSQVNRYDAARIHLAEASAIFESVGDVAGLAGCHLNLGLMASAQGQSREGIKHYSRSLIMYRQASGAIGQAITLNNLGCEHGLIGDHARAIAFSHTALALLTDLGDRHGQAHCQDNLAYSHQHLGNHAQAAEHFRTAIDTFHELGDQLSEATCLARLGDARAAAHDRAGAGAAWAEALVIFDVLDAPDALTLRAKVEQAQGAGRR